MGWMEELQLTKRPLPEIGMATIIRQTFANRLEASYNEAEAIFGTGWRPLLESLEKSGIASVAWHKYSLVATIRAPGDDKRNKIRTLAKIKNLEKKFIKGNQ